MEMFPLDVIEGDESKKQGFVVRRSLHYLTLALEKLGIAFVVTGRAAGYINGMNGPQMKIAIALLDPPPNTYSEVVEQRVADMLFDEEELQLFHLDTFRAFYFEDRRVTFLQARCEIVIFRFDDLLPSTRRSLSNFTTPENGWCTTSPLMMVLDYAKEVSRKIHHSLMFGDTRISHGTSDGTLFTSPTLVPSGTISRMIPVFSSMIQNLSPGNPLDARLLEDSHIEAIRYLSKFVPSMSTFLPFRSFLIQPQLAGIDSASSSELSLRFAADAALEILWSKGFATALVGDMANMIHGSRARMPECIKIMTYVARHLNVTTDAIKNLIYAADPDNFILFEGKGNSGSEVFLYYYPGSSAKRMMQFEFSIGSKARHQNRCRIEIVFTTDAPYSNILPLWSREIIYTWPKIDAMPVIPFYLALLFQLEVWYNHWLSNTNRKAQEAHILYQLLHWHLYQHDVMGSGLLGNLWVRCSFWTPQLQAFTEAKVAAYVLNAPFGLISKSKWIRLGWYNETPAFQ